MSSKIFIHPDTVRNSIAGLDQSLARLLSVQNSAAGIRYELDPKILNRGNIGPRLAKVSASLGETAAQMKRLKSFASNSADHYQATENRLNKQIDTLGNINPIDAALNNRIPSDTYELYNNTIGRLEDFLHGLQYMAGAGAMHLLGFRYKDVDGLLRRFEMADEVLYKNKKLPVGKLIQKVENSKLNFLARLMVNPKTLYKFKDKSLAELIYKRFSSFFPKDIVDLSNNVTKLKKELAQSGTTIRNGLNIVKGHAGSILESSLKVGKANWALAAIITAGTEAVGAGIKITENYSIYNGDINKLKEENAKVVGRAVYKTGVVTATSVGGAMIGGTIGSLAGPIGTVVGASVGGFVGSWVGDKIADKTPAFVDQAAVHFKDGIYKGTEAIASGVNKVKDGFESVKDHASNLLNSSKKFFGSLSFGH